MSRNLAAFAVAPTALAAVLACSGAGSPVAPPSQPPAAQMAGAAAPGPVTPSGPAIDRIRQRGTLLVGMDTGEPEGAGTPPMFFPDAAGKPDGFDYHVARWLATTIGVPDVKIVHGKYSELPALLVDKQQFDVLVSGYTPTEKDGIAWSDGYLDFGLCLVVGRNSPIKTVADLWGKAVGIFDDDAAAEEVARMARGYTELVRMEDGYWDALATGRFDAFIYDYPYTVAELRDWYAENPKRRDAFRIAQYNLTESHYAVGVRSAEPELMAAVNEGLRRFRDSDDYSGSIRAYLSGGTKVEAPTGTARRHVVQAGDTLSKIAAKALGDAKRWPEVWTLNKARFPNPHLIEIGDEVILPG